jgi:hypothetical protein
MRRTFASFAVALVVACGGSDDPSSPGDSAVGTYTLRTIGGNALPVVIGTQNGVTVSVTAGTMVLRADRTFAVASTARGVGAGTDNTQTFTSVGTYTVSGGTLTLTLGGSESGRVTGSHSGDTVTLSQDGIVSVYAR